MLRLPKGPYQLHQSLGWLAFWHYAKAVHACGAGQAANWQIDFLPGRAGDAVHHRQIPLFYGAGGKLGLHVAQCVAVPRQQHDTGTVFVQPVDEGRFRVGRRMVVAQLVNEVGLDKRAVAVRTQISWLVDRQQPGIFVHNLVVQVDGGRQGGFGQVAGDEVALADDLQRGGGTAVAAHIPRINSRLPAIPRLVGEAACQVIEQWFLVVNGRNLRRNNHIKQNARSCLSGAFKTIKTAELAEKAEKN